MQPTDSTGEFSIGQLARELGLTTATINFYVTEGVLPPPRKLNRTRAAYTQLHLRLLRLIRRMQASGYSLALIKGALTTYGTDDAGVTKLESIAYFQPIPPLRTVKGGEPIEHFEPVSEGELLVRAACSRERLSRLVELGLVRPRADRFDARDLWVVKIVQAVLDDGVTMSQVEDLAGLIPVAEKAVLPILARAERHIDALRSRELRFSDLFEPYGVLFGYLVDRIATERVPSWRERLYSPDPSDASK